MTNKTQGSPNTSIVLMKQEEHVESRVPSQQAHQRELRLRRDGLKTASPNSELDWARDVLRLADRCQARQHRLSNGASHALPLSLFELKADAVKIVLRLCETGIPRALYMKGLLAEFGLNGLSADRQQAITFYTESSKRGCHRAYYRLGQCLERLGDHRSACQAYESGAAGDDAACLCRLGMLILSGQLGYTKNCVKGVTCLQLSARGADADAPQGAYIYALMLAGESAFDLPPNAIRQSTIESVYYFEKAALLGHSMAQLRLGKAHEYNELECEFSPVLSMHFYRLAAQGNEAEADMAMSKWFLAGSDDGAIERDEVKAYVHADLAARCGLASAEFALGYFHEVGIACEASVEEARTFYKRAAEHGSEEARARIDGIARSGTLSRRDHEHNVSTKIQARHATIKLNSLQARSTLR